MYKVASCIISRTRQLYGLSAIILLYFTNLEIFVLARDQSFVSINLDSNE